MSSEDQTLTANFTFVENDPIVATFTIAPNIRDLNYTHTQSSVSDTWSIKHNLGKFPSVTIVTSNGDLVQADIIYEDDNNLKIKFNGAFAGKAYIN